MWHCITTIHNHDCDRITFRNETAGENATNDADEEVYGNDGDENEVREVSAGDRRTIADADQTGQLDNFWWR